MNCTESTADPGGEEALHAALEAVFRPRTIAVIGATERAGYGARVLGNMQRSALAGPIYPVNPNREKVFDWPCYPSLDALPGAPDLALVVVPAGAVIESLRRCAAAGARAAIVISAGFAELGDDGAARQAQFRVIAKETGLRIVGPNCLGAANLIDGIWPTASSRMTTDLPFAMPGAALVSQSGATAFGPLLALAADHGLGFRYAVSTGNEADLVAADFVEYFLGLPDVRVVSLDARGGARFCALAPPGRSRRANGQVHRHSQGRPLGSGRARRTIAHRSIDRQRPGTRCTVSTARHAARARL